MTTSKSHQSLSFDRVVCPGAQVCFLLGDIELISDVGLISIIDILHVNNHVYCIPPCLFPFKWLLHVAL